MSTTNKAKKRKAVAAGMPVRMALLQTRKVKALESIIVIIKYYTHTLKAQLEDY